MGQLGSESSGGLHPFPSPYSPFINTLPRPSSIIKLPQHHPQPNIRYFISTLEVDNVLVTPVELRVSMGGDDKSTLWWFAAHLPLENTIKKQEVPTIIFDRK
ncbi:hypothetical protein EVAR_43290_1 [Eumeta japonica]|uniref:Uncharacterized protein n=1 Tax=Eumeta variegata TaxID=151549 RepID=A0A4C1WYB0_EUMVA|nr:hypothetical protein EVAR_43290_1 [Eumeta japonica]